MPDRRNRPQDKSRKPTSSAIRYPPSATIDSLLAAMLAERRADAADSDTVHFWGFARTGSATAHDAAHTQIVLDPDAERSPVLDSAEWLIRRFTGRVWAFGLAYLTVGEIFTSPHEAMQAAAAGRSSERATADPICAATIFDARGRTYTSLTYTHLPELGPTPTSVGDTRRCTDAWIALFDQRAVAAHVWAAAITLDPSANHAAIARLRGH
ncbi:hypothetical protein ACIHAX_09025 [Nocardia sp. NPDC051929]|uniref:hypothetical protein n=1 Tax=unclassified Nocardia TaxID=2637762 RepID=UPI003436DD5B